MFGSLNSQGSLQIYLFGLRGWVRSWVTRHKSTQNFSLQENYHSSTHEKPDVGRTTSLWPRIVPALTKKAERIDHIFEEILDTATSSLFHLYSQYVLRSFHGLIHGARTLGSLMVSLFPLKPLSKSLGLITGGFPDYSNPWVNSLISAFHWSKSKCERIITAITSTLLAEWGRLVALLQRDIDNELINLALRTADRSHLIPAPNSNIDDDSSSVAPKKIKRNIDEWDNIKLTPLHLRLQEEDTLSPFVSSSSSPMTTSYTSCPAPIPELLDGDVSEYDDDATDDDSNSIDENWSLDDYEPVQLVPNNQNINIEFQSKRISPPLPPSNSSDVGEGQARINALPLPEPDLSLHPNQVKIDTCSEKQPIQSYILRNQPDACLFALNSSTRFILVPNHVTSSSSDELT